MTTWQTFGGLAGAALLLACLALAALHGLGALAARRIDRWRHPPVVCSGCEARLPAGGELCDTCRAVFDEA